jgi:hypothetical protein
VGSKQGLWTVNWQQNGLVPLVQSAWRVPWQWHFQHWWDGTFF